MGEQLYPNNSINDHTPKKAVKVTKGEVTVKKASLGKQMLNTFIASDLETVKHYVIFDVIVPRIKETFLDVLNRGAEMLMYDGTPRSSRRSNDPNYISYNSMYGNSKKVITNVNTETSMPFDDMIFAERGDADLVLERLCDDISGQYGWANLSDLYEYVGITNKNYMQSDLGWDDLSRARVKAVRGGYILDLPQPKKFKR